MMICFDLKAIIIGLIINQQAGYTAVRVLLPGGATGSLMPEPCKIVGRASPSRMACFVLIFCHGNLHKDRSYLFC